MNEGWFPDPEGKPQQRWWNGALWTEFVFRDGVRLVDPLISSVPFPVTAPIMPQPAATTVVAPRRRRMRPWMWIILGVLAVGLLLALSPLVAVAALVVLITAIVALAKGSRTWLRFRSRGAAAIVAGVSAVVLVGTSSFAAAALPSLANHPATIAAPAAGPSVSAAPTPDVQTPAPSASVDPTPEPTVEPTDEALPTPTPMTEPPASATPGAAATTAVALLSTLPIKGRAPKTGYNRTDDFGEAWMDIDRNGCDTRDDVLARDLVEIEKSGACKVLTGVLYDQYTGDTVSFLRGQTTSTLVQIDHVVALSDAWQKGAQQLTLEQREKLANDPLNLVAVGQRVNEQKSDGDAATWLPPMKAYRCTYVARQVSVKAAYGLWVTQAEHDAIASILSACPKQSAFVSTLQALPKPPAAKASPAPKKSAAPAPVKPPAASKPVPPKKPAAPAPQKPAVVHPGSFCSPAGAVGVTSTGKPMVCRTSATDSRNRWRKP